MSDVDLIKCVLIVSLYLLGSLFEMLANVEELKSCAAPLDIWIILEFVFMLLPIVSFNIL